MACSAMSKNVMKGFTLIEVVISVLIAAMAVMATFSVVLSSFVSGKKADRNQEGATILRYASEKLKAYVSADPTSVDYPLPRGGIWSEDASGQWALWGTAGGYTHDITALLDNLDLDFTFGKPGDAGRSLTYVVTDVDCGAVAGEHTCKRVAFTLTYTE